MSKKEKPISILEHLKQLDESISQSLSVCSSKDQQPFGSLRPQLKALEYSCHGVFWICGSVALLWLSEDPRKEAFFFNILLALFFDILCVAVLKALIRRRRPPQNDPDMFLTWSVDKMSCPSGHSSRALLLTSLLMWLTVDSNCYLCLWIPLLLWCASTSLSRIMLGRHHVGDVLVGLVLGYLEFQAISSVWADVETAQWWLSFFGESGGIVDDL